MFFLKNFLSITIKIFLIIISLKNFFEIIALNNDFPN